MSFPRYTEYRDSGVEWLGDVPAHWHTTKIKYLASFAGGGTPSRERPEYWDGDIPWVSPKDMKCESITDSEECITGEGLRTSATSLIEPGAILIVVRSGILRHTIPAAENIVSVALNQDMKALSFRPERCSAKFFLRWVQGLNRQLLLVWAKQGATVESIEHEYLAGTILALPPTPEQSAIVSFLDRETGKIDALVAEQEKLIALLKEKRQVVISYAVTKGLDPAVPMKDSGIEWLGEVPAHWTVQPVKYVVRTIEQGWSPQCEGIPVSGADQWGVLKVGCVNGGKFDPQENKLLPEALEPLPDLAIVAGDLLVSRANTRDLVGSAAVALADYPNLMLCDKLYRLRLDESRCRPGYLALLLGSSGARGQIEVGATGASDSMQNIAQSTILNLMGAFPPIGEQQLIESFIDRQLQLLQNLEMESQRAIDLLKERRSALISAAVTGKIDVRGTMDKTRGRHEPA